MAERILVVDDEKDLLDLVAYHLTNAGYSVTTAATGEQALEKARERPPELIVLDILLPDLPGLDVCRIRVPALRDHRQDVAQLTGHFADHVRRRLGTGPIRFSPGAQRALAAGSYPGNVRELENVVERAVVLSTGSVLSEELLPQQLRRPNDRLASAELPTNGISYRDAVRSYERRLILRALEASGGVQKHAAELLKVKPTTLHEMMKRLNISLESAS